MDYVDVEALQGMLESRGWQLYMERVDKTLQLDLEELTAQRSETETATIRGKITGLRLARTIPAILLREAKQHVTVED